MTRLRRSSGSLALLCLVALLPASAEERRSPARADVEKVDVLGSAGSYLFRVTVRSPDDGCDRYASWWEVVTPEGELVYRRVFQHSHVDEQPFARSGGPVPIAADQVVIVRAHMSPGGYGGVARRGTVASGFEAVVPPAGFATSLAREPPLPERCAR